MEMGFFPSPFQLESQRLQVKQYMPSAGEAHSSKVRHLKPHVSLVTGQLKTL